MKEKKLAKRCVVMGHEIDPSDVLNPHMQRAVGKNGSFLFTGAFWERMAEKTKYHDGSYYSEGGVDHNPYDDDSSFIIGYKDEYSDEAERDTSDWA
jgi:hypothetical protein